MAGMKTSRDCRTTFLLRLVMCFMLCFRCSKGKEFHGGDERLMRVRGVSLGGWLVTEGWIKPSLFDGITNKDLLDGTGVQLKSVKTGKYLSAQEGGGKWIVAKDSAPSDWGTFKLWRVNETSFNLSTYNKQFMGLDGGRVVAIAKWPDTWETFEIVRASAHDHHNKYRIRIKAPNGFCLQVKTEKTVTADGGGEGGWRDDDDPTVFELRIVYENTKTCRTMQGEFQLINGYGREKASHVLREHWRTFITEKDFKFMSRHGVNAARIPVGWWIASGPNPPWPYVGGSLQALDNAFSWAEKNGIKIIIDLHAAPDSQNGFYHGSSRDGSQEWGLTNESIEQTLAVVDFLASRYANRTSLYGIQPLNEPFAPTATFETVTKFYEAAYNVIRKYSSTVYVLFCIRGSPSPDYELDDHELFPLLRRLPGSVIDTHFYNLFRHYFVDMTVQQNLDFIRINRTAELDSYISSGGVNGPPVFLGEWCDEWETLNATEGDYKRYAQVQKEVYDRATFGWCFWTLKHVRKRWSLEWMIKHGYIKLP